VIRIRPIIMAEPPTNFNWLRPWGGEVHARVPSASIQGRFRQGSRVDGRLQGPSFSGGYKWPKIR
jgi:hypothetical protein